VEVIPIEVIFGVLVLVAGKLDGLNIWFIKSNPLVKCVQLEERIKQLELRTIQLEADNCRLEKLVQVGVNING
jgi:hypothetical protein